LGKRIKRGVSLLNGEYHIAAEVLLVTKEGYFLTTLRHPEKEIYPNKWEITGGAILAGETSIQGGIRECFEETRIIIAEQDLVLLTTTKDKDFFMDTYIAIKDFSLNDIKLQPLETVDAKLCTLEEFEQLIQNGLMGGQRLQMTMAKILQILEEMEIDYK